jgi:phage terminase large subunit
MENDRRDPDKYNHIWEGCCVNIVAGAIYANELRAVDVEGRITRVPYDATKPVHTFWDLGWADLVSIWFVQVFPFEYRLIDFEQGNREALAYYLKKLQDRPYIYGTHYLPHDARAKSLGTGKSVEELMREAGKKVEIVPSLSIADGINAARTIFPQCYFDADKCADGIQALRHYRYGEIKTLGTPTREPLHDDYSHAADSFRYFSIGIKTPKRKDLRPQQPRRVTVSAWS